MVHYEPGQKTAAQTPPPTCPKCGSHRTEIVGRTDDGRTLTLRCNGCGERSTILVDRRATDADNMTDEIEAIRAVGRALAQLPDVASRVRVLRWAAERFEIDATLGAAAAGFVHHAAQANEAADPMLSVDGLQDLFKARVAPPVNDSADDLRLESTDDLTLETTSGLELESAAHLALETQPMPAPAEPHFESTVHTFVSDFQRLALDWQTAFATPAASR